jgi:L-ribulose-5-phosphate 4-epimerase
MMPKELKEKVYQANIDLVKKGLVSHTFGNVSGIDRASGIICIKPSGLDYDEMRPDDMVLLDMDGRIRQGDLKPSSDTKTHIALYKAFQDIGGVVHTHSKFATIWAQARRPIKCLGTTHADYFYGQIPCTDLISDVNIQKDYEAETGMLITDTFKDMDHASMKAVLVASHGPFCWGSDPEEAVFVSSMLEIVAEMSFYCHVLNGDLPNIKQSLLDKHYLRKHGSEAYYGQDK